MTSLAPRVVRRIRPTSPIRTWGVILGVCLLGLGIFLYSEPLKPVLTQLALPNYTYSTSPPLIGDGDPRLLRTEGEPVLSFVGRLNDNVASAFAHCTPADSLGGNWLLALLGRLGFVEITEEGLLTTERNPCGFCHQAAYIEAKALNAAGIPASVFGLNGHVVARFAYEGDAYFVDPDYGVGPFDSGSPDFMGQLRQAYGRILTPPAVEWIVSMYASTGDNESYRSMGYLSSIERRQRMLFHVQDVICILLIAGGTALAGASFAARGDDRRAGKRSGLPAERSHPN